VDARDFLVLMHLHELAGSAINYLLDLDIDVLLLDNGDLYDIL